MKIRNYKMFGFGLALSGIPIIVFLIRIFKEYALRDIINFSIGALLVLSLVVGVIALAGATDPF